jgi:uncharacterized protein
VPRVVCDTNVLVSAFIAAGPPSRIVEEVIAGRLDLVLPEPVIGELKRVLTDKLGFDDARWRQVHDLLLELAAEVVALAEGPADPVTGDLDDDVILACAVHAGVDAVISGDRRHLLPVGEHRGIRIVTPQALLAEIRRT